MRQIISSGSVKGIYLKRNEILKRLKKVSKIAIKIFPEIKDIRIFGSFAKGEETGLSDIDILIISDYKNREHLKVNMKYFNFFRIIYQLELIYLLQNQMNLNNLKIVSL